ncbi:hypothetical protein CRG98_038720, partial [Punica granatum]
MARGSDRRLLGFCREEEKRKSSRGALESLKECRRRRGLGSLGESETEGTGQSRLGISTLSLDTTTCSPGLDAPIQTSNSGVVIRAIPMIQTAAVPVKPLFIVLVATLSLLLLVSLLSPHTPLPQSSSVSLSY